MKPLLGAVGLAADVQIEQSGRWRFPSSTPLTVVSLNSPSLSGWGEAMLAGLQQGFPRTSVGLDRPNAAGLTLYLNWPDVMWDSKLENDSWLARLPMRLGATDSSDAQVQVGVVCIDNHSGQILHRGKLVLRGHWLVTDADWPPILADAFARYASALAAG
ncbi:MAG: hypothetical protein ACR2PZ_26815 [Pseudomonadales bacterium]